VICALAERWGLLPELAERIIASRKELPFDIWIFSGSRSRSTQREVSRTAFDVSTHSDEESNGCPRLSTGADVQPTDIANRVDFATVAQMGSAFVRAGLRWGGGAPVERLEDANPGGPVGVERWHVDLGPRSQA